MELKKMTIEILPQTEKIILTYCKNLGVEPGEITHRNVI